MDLRKLKPRCKDCGCTKMTAYNYCVECDSHRLSFYIPDEDVKQFSDEQEDVPEDIQKVIDEKFWDLF